LYSVLVAGALVAGMAGTSAAAPESFSSGTLSLQVATLDPLSLGPATGNAGITRSGGNITAVTSFPPNVFASTGLLVPVTDPAALPIQGLQATLMNGQGAFAGAPIGGQMPILGVVKVCLFGACPVAAANLSVPISNVGSGGTTVVTGAVNITVKGSPWTTGTINVPAIGTVKGGIAPVGGGTQVTLVTPVFISTNISVSAVVPSFATLQFTVPEPGVAALGVAGVGSLLVLGWRRGKQQG
jgi:hypothetical protein